MPLQDPISLGGSRRTVGTAPNVATMPPRQRTTLEQLSDALEAATDAYAVKCDEAAVAENEYLRVYARAFTTADVAATIRPKHAECAAVEERAVWNIAVASEKAARAKIDELKHRLMAAMSHQKWVGEQT